VEPSLSVGEGKARKLASIHEDRSRLTLTFAQSVDGRIAGEEKKMLALSNAESMIMTHSLRVLHDAILIGVGTACNDNPQLNARLLSPMLDGNPPPTGWLPRPVILDRTLRIPIQCKLLLNHASGTGRQPLIICAGQPDAGKAEKLREAGAEVVSLETDSKGWLQWSLLLQHLKLTHGIRSLMVEGGARVIDDLLACHEQRPLIDDLIITIAPCVIGEHGLPYRRPDWLDLEALSTPSNTDTTHRTYHFNDDRVAVWRYY
jgi:riboflavin-specific deaminase-like protein